MTVSEYQTSTDIANRALQHLGARRITALTDTSKQASEIAFCYDKLRQAELRRNLWVFATRRAVLRALDTTTYVFVPSAWSSTGRYQPGQIVTYNNAWWVSKSAWNVNKTPGTGADWDIYFGPRTVALWDSTLTYSAGEMTYVAGGYAGLASLFAARTSTTAAASPATIPAYDAATTYQRGDNVSYLGSNYISLVNLNTGNTPASTYGLWDITHTYALNDVVTWTDGRLYTAASGTNLAHEPAVGSAYWTAAVTVPYVQPWLVTTGGVNSQEWRYIGNGVAMELAAPYINWPLETDPDGSTSRSTFLLPNGFLRTCPQQPRAGATSYLGAPSGLAYTDWELDGQYLLSADDGPIAFRFLADVTNVPDFDPMFCEGLACRIALETCEAITQSSDKKKDIQQAYAYFMSQARLVDAVEAGPTEPAEDDYVTCRQ